MREGASIVCVLGMHSTGTSLTAGLLSRLGVDFGPPEVAPAFQASAADWIDPELWRNRAGAAEEAADRIEDPDDRALYLELRRASRAHDEGEHRRVVASATEVARSLVDDGARGAFR